MAQKMVVLMERDIGRTAIAGLTAEKCDELYEAVGRELGEENVMGVIGPPYTIYVDSEHAAKLNGCIREFCQKDGYKIAE